MIKLKGTEKLNPSIYSGLYWGIIRDGLISRVDLCIWDSAHVIRTSMRSSTSCII